MQETTNGQADSPKAAEDLAPLCVDLDGTLVKSDTLVDAVLVLARQDFRHVLRIPGWIAQGKASFKRHVNEAVKLNVAALPYNRELLEYLYHQHAEGRELYLATAADRVMAERVAAHLDIFAGVFASDGAVNLAGKNKLAAFRERFGDRFSYVGNASPDIPLLTACLDPMVANPTAGLRAGLKSAKVTPVRSFMDTSSPIKAWLKAIRLHQWAKNVLIFAPLILAHSWFAGSIVASLIAFVSFGLCASATYIVNDLLDLEADRQHARKRNRPFAAGNLSAISGVMVVALFLAISAGLALLLPVAAARLGQPLIEPMGFFGWLILYAFVTSAYSFLLKRVVMVDVIVLAGLYTIRIIAGAAATGIPISPWLGGFSIFFFLSLAFVKRFAELESLHSRGLAPANGRGYLVADIEQLRSFGTSAGYASVVVLTLYISAVDVRLYHHGVRLWLLLPVMLLWLSQLWLLASRG
ncbi:4-hydroxybenzoate polyprenyltransferase, partial [Granulicella rosea]